MTSEELDAIRGRLTCLSPTPWTADPMDSYGADWQVECAGSNKVVGKDMDYPDAEFIANAPTDIAALLAEVERLKTRNFTLDIRLGNAIRDKEAAMDALRTQERQVESLLAEVERLRSELIKLQAFAREDISAVLGPLLKDPPY